MLQELEPYLPCGLEYSGHSPGLGCTTNVLKGGKHNCNRQKKHIASKGPEAPMPLAFRLLSGDKFTLLLVPYSSHHCEGLAPSWASPDSFSLSAHSESSVAVVLQDEENCSLSYYFSLLVAH